MITMKQSCIIVRTSIVVNTVSHGFLPLLVVNVNIIITIIISSSSLFVLLSFVLLKDNDYVNGCCCLIKLVVDTDINMSIIMLSPKENTSKY